MKNRKKTQVVGEDRGGRLIYQIRNEKKKKLNGWSGEIRGTHEKKNRCQKKKGLSGKRGRMHSGLSEKVSSGNVSR